MVACKAEAWCQQIIPVDILLPLLNLQRRYHSNEIERIKELYEPSLCCVGEGNMQFIDQQKWMAHCLPCGGKYCVVCLNGQDPDSLTEVRRSERPTLA